MVLTGQIGPNHMGSELLKNLALTFLNRNRNQCQYALHPMTRRDRNRYSWLTWNVFKDTRNATTWFHDYKLSKMCMYTNTVTHGTRGQKSTHPDGQSCSKHILLLSLGLFCVMPLAQHMPIRNKNLIPLPLDWWRLLWMALRTPNHQQVAKIFLFCKLVSNIAKSIQIFYEFFWNNEILKIWYDFAIFDTSLLKRKKLGNL